jgi:hypothetical protein
MPTDARARGHSVIDQDHDFVAQMGTEDARHDKSPRALIRRLRPNTITGYRNWRIALVIRDSCIAVADTFATLEPIHQAKEILEKMFEASLPPSWFLIQGRIPVWASHVDAEKVDCTQHQESDPTTRVM